MSRITIDQAFATAHGHHQAGRLQQAEAIYRQILAQNPNHAGALHLLGVIAYDVGRHEDAVNLIGRAIALEPGLIEAHSNLGLVLKSQGKLDEAIASYRRVLALKPDDVAAHCSLATTLQAKGQLDAAMASFKRALALKVNYHGAHLGLGNLLWAMGQLDQAMVSYQQAIVFKPDFAEAHNNIGLVLREKGRLDEAIVSYQHAAALKPDYREAHNNLAAALWATGRLDEAIASYQRAMALKPNDAEVHNNLGSLLHKKGQLDEAMASFERAVALKPNYSEAYNNLGNLMWERRQFDGAIINYKRALAIRPDNAGLHNNLGNVLRERGRLDEAIVSFRRAMELKPDEPDAHNHLGNVLKDDGQLDEALASYRRGLALKPDNHICHSSVIFTLHYHPKYDAAALLHECQAWNRRFALPLAAEARPHANDPAPDRRLKIGYVSPDFTGHPVGRFLLPLLERHDHRQFEIVCYADVRTPDHLTKRLASCADQWHDIVRLSDEQVAARIRADGIDILVDLAMHTMHNRLLVFARKPAPVQVTYLAYCSTTGLDAMDYRLTDPFLDPPDQPDYPYSEKSVWLPRSYWCYQPANNIPAMDRPPATQAGFVTFGSLNNFCKVNEPLLLCWCRIMREVADARLMINARLGDCRQRVQSFFASQGIDPARVSFTNQQRLEQYFSQYNQIDIALDTFPFNGGTTSCDALWMGVPVISQAGQTAVGRAGRSILSNAGLPELVGENEDQYVRLAVELARDLPRLTALCATLRQRMQTSPLMDAAQFTSDMESAYRRMWRQRCEKRR